MPTASHPIPSPGRNHAPKRVTSTTFRTLRVSVSLTAQSTSLRESLGWSNQRGSKTSQACYSRPRCNLNLVRIFRFSLLLPLIGRIFFFPHPRDHKPTTPFVYLFYTTPQGHDVLLFLVRTVTKMSIRYVYSITTVVYGVYFWATAKRGYTL